MANWQNLLAYAREQIGICHYTIKHVQNLFQSWHVEHFVCHHCEKPFLNDTYFVGADDGKPYCEYHYNKLFGDSCTWCGRVIQSQVIQISTRLSWMDPDGEQPN